MALRSTVHEIVKWPVINNWLRRILEFNYRGEKLVIKKEIPWNVKVLDMGCGTGELCQEFPMASYSGIDVNPINIKYAKRRYPGYRFNEMNATSLSFERWVFDVVLIAGVLHHCDQQVVTVILQEVDRVLKDDGKVVIWEDVLTRKKYNFIGRMVHAFDQGDYILSEETYMQIFSTNFAINDTYPMRSGFCDYRVFVLSKRT